MLVLRAIAQAPRSNNRAIAQAAGLSDEGQTSKLLSRLKHQGLVENVGLGQAYGEPNAWLLTREGRGSRQALEHPGASRKAHKSKAGRRRGHPARLTRRRQGSVTASPPRPAGAGGRHARAESLIRSRLSGQTAHRRSSTRTPMAIASMTGARIRGTSSVCALSQTSGSQGAFARSNPRGQRSSGQVRHVRMLGLCLVAILAFARRYIERIGLCRNGASVKPRPAVNTKKATAGEGQKSRQT